MRSLMSRSSPKRSKNSSDMSHGNEVIEFAYGRNADLYEDVLVVPRDAGTAQIQSAFFDRRYELYDILAKEEELSPTERHFAERRMDAVVAAFRILSNPKSRAEYDARTNTSTSSNSGKGKKATKSASGAVGSDSSSPGRESQQSAHPSLPPNRMSIEEGTVSTISTMGMRGPTTKRSIRRTRTREKEAEAEAQRRLENDDDTSNASGRESEYMDEDGTAEWRRDVNSRSNRSSKHNSSTSRSSDKGSSSGKGKGGILKNAKKQGNHRQHRSSRRDRAPTDPTDEDDSEAEVTVATAATAAPLDEVEVAGCSALQPFDLCTRPRRVGLAIKEEVFGAVDDTKSAFDQVIHVFTLQRSDINAVVSEIDEAKRGLRPARRRRKKGRA